VLVCSENSITYKHQDHKSITAPLPRRFGLPDDRGIIITSVATHTQKDLFFFLLQSELGDIFKVTLQYDEETVEDLQVPPLQTNTII
jgi:splicing factor 3B subunit 3